MNDLKHISLLTSIREVLDAARQRTYRAVNAAMVLAYWEIGRLIIEDEQNGQERAEYGKSILKELSRQLTVEYGKGFDESNLRRMRLLYTIFPIQGSLRPELTWTHYIRLIKIENIEARNYYLEEAITSNWSSRALARQINTSYYERLLASKNKQPVIEEARVKTELLKPHPKEFIKDPYVLEFLGLDPDGSHREKDMEEAIITHLQKFLLEMGKGYAFVARQKHIRTELSDYFIDLVFYNYILKCFVIIDLKIGALTHQDIGQMDMYVRMFEDLQKGADDNPTIGIILCSDKDETEVKYSVLKGNDQLFASTYKLYLPAEEELKRLISEDRFLLENEKKQGEH